MGLVTVKSPLILDGEKKEEKNRGERQRRIDVMISKERRKSESDGREKDIGVTS